MSEEETAEVYCVCRTADSDRFMIGCDSCEEWYHGDCINVTEREAKYIKSFFCRRCRKKNPNLKIKYKEKHKALHKSDKGEKHSKAEKAEKPEKTDKAEKYEKHKSHKHEKHERTLKQEKTDKLERHEKQDKSEKHEASKKSDKQEKREKADKPEKSEKLEKSEKHEKLEKQDKSLSKHDSVDKKSREARQKSSRDKRELSEKERRPPQAPPFPAAAAELDRPQRQPSPVLREVNGPAGPPVTKLPSPSPPPLPLPPPKQKQERRRSQETRRVTGAVRRRKRPLSEEEEDEPDTSTRQCCGPQCIQTSRPGSRYCSDQCGLNLARNRIFQVLPQRIQEWNMTRCVAEDHNMRTLERIRRQQLQAQTQLERLQRSHAELDRAVERGRRGAVDPAALDDDTDDEQHSIHCVTCGHEVLTRNAVRHMEKCFGKYESQTSFGSLYQTRVEGFNMFCDFYNPAQRTYCKRLRVLCPEHCKNTKVGDDEVCGCPLVVDVFQETGRYCRAPRKKCLRHFSWEKLRRAELDMERVRWAMKMDDLLEQERQCRHSMASRAGVLALMLHSTYDHEVMEKVQSQQKKMANKVKVKHS